MLALGEKPGRVVKDKDGLKRYIHSLGSVNYLKIESTNHLLFACQFYEDRQICLQEQYNDHDGNTHFDDIFKIKINEITLRELLLIQSIYACHTQSDIERLVNYQPNPTIFFKVFLELGVKSLVSYLAFDSRSIKSLLSEKNHEYFDSKFPVFYKNEDGGSAIDVSLSKNQIRSVNLMINYIIKHQNSFVFSHLFEFNLVDLLNKGVTMAPLFNSSIFNHTFDFDEWPATNSNTKKVLAPFNKSMFKLRFEYPDIYRNIYLKDHAREQKALAGKLDLSMQKVFKIKYQLNILTSMSENDGSITEAISSSEELEIFKTDVVKDMLDYKWQAFAQRQHRIGAFIHTIYVIVLILYINLQYLETPVTYVPAAGCTTKNIETEDCSISRSTDPADPYYLWIIFVCLFYPLAYDGTQAFKQGASYLEDPWNYVDIMHISLGYVNIYTQGLGPLLLSSKIIMIIVVLVCLIKTFFFMRIVMSFSYIVTMIQNVIIDLRVFLLFFAILILKFSMIFDVISPNDAAEYKHVGKYSANLLTTLRLSLGDFDFGVLEDDDYDYTKDDQGNITSVTKVPLNKRQHILFWITWVLMVIFSSLIFLNFIIAEVSNSYANVKVNIDALIYKERAGLINEAEDIMSANTKKTNKTKFPKYIVIRENED
uniref:Ion transport domain-containing protein n=1 Tax=Strombidium inclinatum TaxID=197538 RepID=A0A7S3ILI3_9SPIT|mmetsp:Transcript_2676/g.4190  ORF Transcript_2676/g.4190 Transcript_2676/m.4190 type:complete len:653 (+) Transcript_2676:1216-3174(+)